MYATLEGRYADRHSNNVTQQLSLTDELSKAAGKLNEQRRSIMNWEKESSFQAGRIDCFIGLIGKENPKIEVCGRPNENDIEESSL